MPNSWNTQVQKCAKAYNAKKNVRRGRPKGSKNKPKMVEEKVEVIEEVVKRGRGRPKGSKNKPK